MEKTGHVQDAGLGLLRKAGQNALDVIGNVTIRLQRNGLACRVGAGRAVAAVHRRMLQRSEQNPAQDANVGNIVQEFLGAT